MVEIYHPPSNASPSICQQISHIGFPHGEYLVHVKAVGFVSSRSLELYIETKVDEHVAFNTSSVVFSISS